MADCQSISTILTDQTPPPKSHYDLYREKKTCGISHVVLCTLLFILIVFLIAAGLFAILIVVILKRISGYLVPNQIGPYYRGFFCDDDTIRYNYKPNSIPFTILLVAGLLVTFATIIITEFLRIRKIEQNISLPKYRWRNSHINVLIVRIATYIGYSQIGFMCTLIVMQVTKIMVGELRPYFIEVCQLDENICKGKEHVYLFNYTCNGDPAQVLEARKSFMSGHAAISMYCFVFSSLYIQARLQPILQNRIFIPIIQTSFLLTALMVSYSRITDHWHHSNDVIFGIILGTFMALYCVSILYLNFEMTE
ncbi:hypothetical protein WR25_12896 [Diploscapter pachys]|uniref:Phosphatidic acid phosphatase type 2/haloperoxidase domain-containing protein n=1 Tax=Diploscapter pachys TaxID=2018661 RepID=A0A2A2LFQ2_9BILA|nr:hypothetical protein WR25_12896 [Diploscapter pachys]